MSNVAESETGLQQPARPLLPPVQVLSRDDSVQLRMTVQPGPEMLEMAIHRKSPIALEDFDSFQRTNAGFLVPLDRLAELIAHLQAVHIWWTTR